MVSNLLIPLIFAVTYKYTLCAGNNLEKITESPFEDWMNVGDCGKGLTCNPECQLLCLKMHNYYRSLHNAPPLSCDQEIAKAAQSWTEEQARQGKMFHSEWTDKYTESISWKGWGWKGMEKMEGAIPGAARSWYSEIKNDYNYATGKGNGQAVGHFMAVVWKSETKLGCGLTIKENDGTYVTANYAPASHANVDYFELAPKNVLKRKDPDPSCDIRSSERKLCSEDLKAPFVTPEQCLKAGCCYDDMFMSEPGVDFFGEKGRTWCFVPKGGKNPNLAKGAGEGAGSTETGKTGEAGKSEETVKTEESGKTGETGKTTGETGTTGQTGETGTTGETGKTTGSPETGTGVNTKEEKGTDTTQPGAVGGTVDQGKVSKEVNLEKETAGPGESVKTNEENAGNTETQQPGAVGGTVDQGKVSKETNHENKTPGVETSTGTTGSVEEVATTIANKPGQPEMMNKLKEAGVLNNKGEEVANKQNQNTGQPTDEAKQKVLEELEENHMLNKEGEEMLKEENQKVLVKNLEKNGLLTEEGRNILNKEGPSGVLKKVGQGTTGTGVSSESVVVEEISKRPESQELMQKLQSGGLLSTEGQNVAAKIRPGVPQVTNVPVVSTPVTQTPNNGMCVVLDLGFLVDGSMAVGGEVNFKQLLNFVWNVVQSFIIGPTKTRVGIVVSSLESFVIFNFHTYYEKPNILQALNTIQYPGTDGPGTYIGRGLRVAKKFLFYQSGRENVPQALIVLAGGLSLDDVITPGIELRAMGVDIYTVGVGSKYSKLQLHAMASFPHSEHIFGAEIPQLALIAQNVVTKVLKGVSVNFCHPCFKGNDMMCDFCPMDFDTILFRRGHDKMSSKHQEKDYHHNNSTVTDQDDDNPEDEISDTSDTPQDLSSLPSYLKESSSENKFDTQAADDVRKQPERMLDWNYLKSKAKRLELLNAAIRREEENYSEYKYDTKSAGFITEECRDLADECEVYASQGYCSSYAPNTSIGTVSIMCKRSCGLCGHANPLNAEKRSNGIKKDKKEEQSTRRFLRRNPCYSSMNERASKRANEQKNKRTNEWMDG